MTVEETLVAALTAWPALAGVKIFADVADDGAVAPYIVYTMFTGTRVKSLAGDSGLANPHFQLDVYASKRGPVTTLKNAVRDAVLADAVLGAVFLNEGSGYEPARKLRRQRQDFSFWFYD